MVSASTRTAAGDPLAKLTLNSLKPGVTKNSFAQQLATAVKGPVNTSLNGALKGSHVGSDVSEVAGQKSAGSQFLVARAPVASTAATAKSATTSDEIPTMLGMGPTVSAKSTVKAVPTMLGMGPAARRAPVISTAAATSPLATKIPVAQATVPEPLSSPARTEGDAYWAAQPAAVQALRGMPDDNAKEKLALSLANQGYSIDTQIMVWGWDPQMTMQVRENQGYSWVPSFGQSNVPVGPGVSDPFDPRSYDPASPPPGSIQVSTAFDTGTILNPLVQADPTNT